MKHGLFYILSFFFFLFILVSCSVEKRRYTNGYHVEWLGERSSRQVNHPDVITEALSSQTPMDSTINTEVSGETTAQSSIEDTLTEPSHLVRNKAMNPSDISPSVKRTTTPKTTRIVGNFLGSRAFSSMEGAVQLPQSVDTSELHPVGMALGMIGFVFALVALACFVVALFIATGWAALGYISIGFIGAVLAGIFAWIAQGIFMTHHQGVPWFQWLGLIIGLVGFYALIRIIFNI